MQIFLLLLFSFHFFLPLKQVVMLVLAWKLDAQNMGYFTLQEWLKGMTSLQ